MKKTLLIFVISLSAYKSGSAQDLIIKSNGDTIKSRIIEVTDEAVRYKKSNNPDGPTFISGKAELNRIIYANGTEEKMEVKNAPPKSEPPPAAKPTEPNIDTRSNPSPGSKGNSITSDFEEIHIEHFGYYYKGMRMNDARLNYLFRSYNDVSIMNEFKSARNLKTTATIVSLVGIPLAVGGVILSIISFVPTEHYNDQTGEYETQFNNRNLLGPGIGLFAGFIAMEVTSAVLRGTSKTKVKKTIQHYNNVVAKHEMK